MALLIGSYEEKIRLGGNDMPYFKFESKNVYYQELGEGKPLLFLHGNTASSKMFELMLPFYVNDFKVILLDFLGHGESDRVAEFPIEIWKWEAKQTIALLWHLNYSKVSLAGTSGGAWVAVNAALECPELIDKVVADSFSGRTLEDGFAKALIEERTAAKADVIAWQFYEWCQGDDWEKIVNDDTKALTVLAEQNLPLFVKPIEQLQVPLLLMGSRGDTMVREDLQEEYEAIRELTGARICIFESGGHPAIGTNGEQAAEVIKRFINN